MRLQVPDTGIAADRARAGSPICAPLVREQYFSILPRTTFGDVFIEVPARARASN